MLSPASWTAAYKAAMNAIPVLIRKGNTAAAQELYIRSKEFLEKAKG